MEIIVVGGGIVGCAIAHELASRGARVRLIEARGIGQGATRASAGILAPRIEGQDSALLKLGLCSLALYDDFIRRVQADAQRAVEYERCGTLQVALDSSQADRLEQAAAILQDASVEHSLFDDRGARAIEPQLPAHVVAALLIPFHGYVDPNALTTLLARAAQNLGVEVSTARVVRVQGNGQRAEALTVDEVSPADAVIVAAGSWSSVFTGVSGPPLVKPIRGQLLDLELPERQAFRVLWGSGCYLVPRRDGSVLVGASVEDVGFDERPSAEAVHTLLDAAFELMPALRHARFKEVRVGLRPMTSDELPIVGRSSTIPNVFYATGHYRNGVLLAPLTAAAVADLVLDGRERPELALMRPDRFEL